MLKENVVLATLLNRAEATNNLSFSMTNVLKRLALGLDEEERKLIVAQQANDGSCDWQLIHIDDIRLHYVRKTYKHMNARDLESGILEEYLETITLYIELKNSHRPIELVFYDHIENNIFELPELDPIAKDWEISISRILMYGLTYRNQYAD